MMKQLEKHLLDAVAASRSKYLSFELRPCGGGSTRDRQCSISLLSLSCSRQILFTEQTATSIHEKEKEQRKK